MPGKIYQFFLTDQFCLWKNKCNKNKVGEVTLLSNNSTFSKTCTESIRDSKWKYGALYLKSAVFQMWGAMVQNKWNEQTMETYKKIEAKLTNWWLKKVAL